MVNVVVVTLLIVFEMAFWNKYVPFRAICPTAPVMVTRLLFASVHAGIAELGQSPGLTSPGGDLIATVAVVPEFTIETNWEMLRLGFDSALAKVLQKYLEAPNAWPAST